jgi:hypothetical protein
MVQIMMKRPTEKRVVRASFLERGRDERRRRGRGMERMRRSEVRLKVKFVIRWWVAVVHWTVGEDLVGHLVGNG